jgi:outer membrane lipoprotein-sorting protein
VVAAVVAGAFIAPPLIASAGDHGLPPVTPEALLAQVAAARPSPLSGTVVYTARLGLPEIPFASAGGADPIVLLGGSSTMRVWSDGADRSRVALLGATSEYSVVRDGAQAWTYSSANDAVVHYALNAQDAARYDKLSGELRTTTESPVAGGLPTPEEAARAALAHADKSSVVTLDAQTTVAGRAAYQLVVTPRSENTLVARIVVAIDAATSTPLRVQAWSTQDSTTPALELGFTDVRFATPDPAVLTFSAPAGATVKDVVVPLPDESTLAGSTTKPTAGALPDGVSVTGTGWATVVTLAHVDVKSLVAGDPAALTGALCEPMVGSVPSAQGLIQEFQRSDGKGHRNSFSLDTAALYQQLTTQVPEGRLLSSALLSVLVTNDGRVLVGAVPAETLRGMA